MGLLYILTGASGSGKTTLLNSICTGQLQEKYNTIRAPKYSEREHRGDSDDIIHVDQINDEEYSIAYVINNKKYGVKIAEIEKLTEQGKNVFVVLSDFRIVKTIKKLLPGKVVSIYIASSVDPEKLVSIQKDRYGLLADDEKRRRLHIQFLRLGSVARLDLWEQVFECMGELVTDWKAFLPESDSTEIRASKIAAFHQRYVDNLAQFDFVILNYNQGKPVQMTNQLINILGGQKLKHHHSSSIKKSKLFVVAASSGAGKGTLMEMLGMIGKSQIAIISKQGKRGTKGSDKRDGMTAIGVDGIFGSEYDMKWVFHQPIRDQVEIERNDATTESLPKFEGIEYAISTAEINRNFELGIHQIVISNIRQFDRFSALYPDQVVFLYLHRMVSTKEMTQYQMSHCHTQEEAQHRLDEIDAVHDDYIDNICKFNHVLLNTNYREDLYNQMFHLLDHYS